MGSGSFSPPVGVRPLCRAVALRQPYNALRQPYNALRQPYNALRQPYNMR